MTEAEVLGGFQVSPQPTHAPETSWAAPKGAEGVSVRDQGFNRHCEERQQELDWRRAASKCPLYL